MTKLNDGQQTLKWNPYTLEEAQKVFDYYNTMPPTQDCPEHDAICRMFATLHMATMDISRQVFVAEHFMFFTRDKVGAEAYDKIRAILRPILETP